MIQIIGSLAMGAVAGGIFWATVNLGGQRKVL